MSARAPFYTFNAALVRQPAKSVVHGIRAGEGGDPAYEGVRAEHAAYIDALQSAGVNVETLPPLESHPDSIFMEDPALVFTEGAILLRTQAESRVGEAEDLAPILRRRFDRVLELPGHGCVDGGDVLVTAGAVVIGLSDRTNPAGAEALQECLLELGHRSMIARTPPGVLHFKTACSMLDEETIVVTNEMEPLEVFEKFNRLVLSEGEEGAANALRVNDRVFIGAEFPLACTMLDQAGYEIVPLPTREISKLDAGLSCLSLRWLSV